MFTFVVTGRFSFLGCQHSELEAPVFISSIVSFCQLKIITEAYLLSFLGEGGALCFTHGDAQILFCRTVCMLIFINICLAWRKRLGVFVTVCVYFLP